jgi:hypothetical protein
MRFLCSAFALSFGVLRENRTMWSITYDRITHESAEHGEAEQSGFLHEGLTFREAIDALRWQRGCHVEADSSPISAAYPPRWFTFYEAETDISTGDVINYALHIPKHITPSSRMRVARFLRCYGAK